MDHKYPYQETVINKLPGERWKDIPGFEGYYKASNMGRIRSLDRIIPHPRLYQQTVKGRILRQRVFENKNLEVGDSMIDLRVSLSFERKQYFFNTRRLIYSTFKKRIHYQDDGLYVINIDGDGYNCASKNLKLVSKSEKQKRVIERDRQTPYLTYADRSQWKKPYGGAVRRMPVEQLVNGKPIAEFGSITEASQKTGFGEKEIINVAKGRIKSKTWAGFGWRYLKKK